MTDATPPTKNGNGAPDWWPFVRDAMLFLFGLLGVAYETLFARPPDPSLLVLFAGMLGLPVFLRKDGR